MSSQTPGALLGPRVGALVCLLLTVIFSFAALLEFLVGAGLAPVTVVLAAVCLGVSVWCVVKARELDRNG